MALAAVTLDDKYEADAGRIFLTGTQALVRLPMMQRRRDQAAGLDTACFISGYRGSPLGSLDRELWRAQAYLDSHRIHFRPGVNEELAATSVWGSQQVNMFEGARHDGVFAMWYGKGAGLDRSGDVMRHANGAGTSPHGGVLVVVGDDHALKSSSQAYNSEPTFVDLMMPVLYPADIQEILEYGLYGWAMSRYSGCWVGFKVLADTVDSSGSVDVDPGRVDIVLPEDFEFGPEGAHIGWPDPWAEQEVRLQQTKLPAALAFARANRLNRVVVASPRPRFGIVTAGKSYRDVRQALSDLGIDDAGAAALGITLYKVAMPWPLDVGEMWDFAAGLEEVLVVEEKRRILETHLKDVLYELPEARRPRIVGRYDERREPLLSSTGEISPDHLAGVIARRIAPFHESERIAERLAFLEAKERRQTPGPVLNRLPYFCSGCPHNTSTKVPEGSRALAGVGCHYMAVWMNRNTSTFTQMGGEGATWIGAAPFSDTEHVFVNMGEGTYYHSGLLALRACVAADVTITFKILFNDAVAMTGGQPLDGPLTVPRVTQQVYAEGVRSIAVLSDEPDKYPQDAGFAPGVAIAHRDELERVQKELREEPGVSVLVYDQVCAAEKRRRRKRGKMPDPPRRVFINEAVCEGCGDCSRASNCLSVVPVDTEWGRKRMVDQSSCNKDYACVDGFCPSFVTVDGGAPAKRVRGDDPSPLLEALPEPALPAITEGESYGIFITGVGGTGVVTISALLGMAAHLEGKGVGMVDMLGMAQKGGAVVSHVRIAARDEDIHGIRLNAGAARLLLGCDLLVAAGEQALAVARPGVTRAIVNAHEAITGDFTLDPDLAFPGEESQNAVRDAVGAERAEFIDATRLATALMGDSIATNLFMLGYAYQKGLVPVSGEALERAIELNGVAVATGQRTFRLGRLAALDRDAVEALAAPAQVDSPSRRLSTSLEEIIERRVAYLTAYKDEAHGARYRRFVERVREVEGEKTRGREELTETVARAYFKLLSVKDEYEVARLYTAGEFRHQLEQQFEGDVRLRVHLAPPLIARRDPATGEPRKRAFGPWIFTLFRLLARIKGLRGTLFDPFGYGRERKLERRLLYDYERTVAELIAELDHDNHALALEIAAIPERIRGFGHVKQTHLAAAKEREAELMAAFRAPRPSADAA